ncbi:hypothetical protein MtrunA17_Chr5g0417891 [Medicago truncatula]|uniref:Emp24/gp25L/p24 family protein n=1 Tax=Medicago truncatula TaxID=3880 RepID=G7JWH6_MEDTR|nr:emp24/gp25L/p24 family protein [Medicago truncatula]RHN55449.1 hypothetical protein MtrunA17_Chr5g0417891 [Medicago truncatula]
MIGSNPQPHLLFLLVLMVGLFTCLVQSMRFDLQTGVTRCIAEDIKKNSMTIGNYSIVNPNEGQPLPSDHTISVQVSTHGGSANHHLATHVQSGQFAFVAHQSGDYLVCFFGDKTHDSQATLSIDFVWKTGVAAKDWSKIAKKSHIDRMQLEVQILQETAMSIKEEISYLHERGVEMLDFNSTTNSRMLWLSFVSFLICFSVAGLQLWHLKTFFKKNKIL